ncbi:hypothetical protein GCM10010254_69810 [Streptomyces chromofuscus]|nr:hypothetical protein GCM10010254_69810 [Streptomyces chromofuscus]
MAEMVGVDGAETITDWVPAVLPFAHMTTTVYVPGVTFVQAAFCRALEPVTGTRRPWAKVAWPLLRSEAVPQLPFSWVQALVVTETVEPLVLTEIPEFAAAGPATRASGSAAAVTAAPRRG